ncbi:Transposable element P transposase [Amphibalanus amphitrite]|uniref:Transposable element P transposase n=1 Tax=Amphibalanus amphitrite TaxID=1232801 RepID=A0A6A4VMG3_AMPAM|nr:Transposable element P transposase [Amphibalanus amphitrite]
MIKIPINNRCTRCPALEAELASLKSKLAELHQLQAPSSALKRHLFTDQQAENLFTGKAPYRWDDESVYKALELFLVSGIFTTWKLPMLYAFDTPVTKELLLKLIKAVEGAGGRVVSTVSDMGSGNLALWRSLGIGHDAEASICNPADPSR